MEAHRPVLISVVQYLEAITAGKVGMVDVVEAAHRLGVDGAELRPPFWKDKARELPVARDRAHQYGVLITYATMGALYGTNAAVLRQDIDDARALGSPILRLFPGPLPADDDAVGWETGHAIARYAAEQGIVLAVENSIGTPGGTLAEITRTLDHIPTLTTNIDTGNYVRHGQDVPAAIRSVGARAIATHLKDESGLPAHTSTALGEGVLPLAAMLDELDRLPQQLLYILEFGGGDDPEGRIARSIAYLQGRTPS